MATITCLRSAAFVYRNDLLAPHLQYRQPTRVAFFTACTTSLG